MFDLGMNERRLSLSRQKVHVSMHESQGGVSEDKIEVGGTIIDESGRGCIRRRSTGLLSIMAWQ